MIRTTDELLDKIGQDHIWRRKELTELRALVQTYRDDPVKSRVLIRAAVALLYAHWEGFVKKSSSDYLEYVASHRLPYNRLAINFVGLTLKRKFSELSVSKKMAAANALASFFCTEMARQSNVPYKKELETSNLTSAVLEDIIETLGLDQKKFATRLKYIDGNLVNPRNHIAHGQSVGMSVLEYFDLHEQVLWLIETYKNEVENASVEKRFERKPLNVGE